MTFDDEYGLTDNMRPRRLLRAPRRLPDTPTKAHQPSPRRVRNATHAQRKCPYCAGQLRIDKKTFKVTKSEAVPKVSKKWMAKVDGVDSEKAMEMNTKKKARDAAALKKLRARPAKGGSILGDLL